MSDDSRNPLSDPIFRRISRLADAMGVRAYVVGGYVRDYYLGRPSTDIDVVVVGSGIAVAEALAAELHTRLSVFKTFGTAMLRAGGMEVEFVGARKESYSADSRKPAVEEGTLEDDQLRRDFTINALAWSLNGDTFGELVDSFEGLRDLRERIIRTPCDADVTFSDDPLRMMRAVRFAAQLGFDILPETFAAIRRNRERIRIVSRERIAVELNKIVASAVPSRGFDLLERSGLLALIFPEMQALKGVERVGRHAHKDNFYHTLKVLDNVAAKSDDLWLRWAAVLHDIAKPLTKAYDPQTGWTFHSHETLGSKMVPQIFRRMKLPMNEHMKFVQKMVFLHLRPIILSEDQVTDSAVRRLLFEAGDDIENKKSMLVLCASADMTVRYVDRAPGIAFEVQEMATSPLTLILPGAAGVAANLIPEEGTLGVRIPDHEFCQGLLRRFGRPIVSTSANITGEPTPKRLPEIAREIVDGVDYVVNPRFEGRPTGKPSSIIAFTEDGGVKVIRQ